MPKDGTSRLAESARQNTGARQLPLLTVRSAFSLRILRCSSSAAATLAIRLRLRPAFSTSALVRFTCRLPSASSQQPREQRTIPTARLPVFAARRFVARLVHHAIALLAALAESFTAGWLESGSNHVPRKRSRSQTMKFVTITPPTVHYVS